MTAPHVSHTGAHAVHDHIFPKALRSVLRVFSVAQLTRPFWNRWRAVEVGGEAFVGFLNAIRTLEVWPAATERMIFREEATFGSARASMMREAKIAALRRLSCMCTLGHRGIMPMNAVKRAAYIKARDCYLKAEQLAGGSPNTTRPPAR